MDKNRKNKKAFYFLIILCVFGFLCFKFTKINTAKGNNENPESCSTTVTNTNSNVLTSNDIFLSLTEDGVYSDITPQKGSADTTEQVLGTNSGGSCPTNSLYEASSSCGRTSNGFSADGKNFVASEVDIEMTTINAPLVILSGSEKTSIKDSNREITKSSPVYKPGGEQFTVAQALVFTAPGEANKDMEEKLTTGAKSKTSFGTKYTLSTGSSETGDGAIVVNKYANSDLVECNNPSNPNPTKSNTVGEYLGDRLEYPNQDKETVEQTNTTVEINNTCENRQEADFGEVSTSTCVNTWSAIAGGLASLFPSSSWGSCDPESDSGCVSSGSLVVKMSPMFKETNSYMEKRNKSLVDPKSSATYGATYVITSCKALIKNKETGAVMANVSVRCVWDLSYLFFERDAAENDDSPAADETISQEAYIEYLKNESLTRANSLTSM